MLESDELLVSLDRIEEGICVLLTRDGQMWMVPAEKLPPEIKEGDILTVNFQRDIEATKDQTRRITQLQQQLLNRTRERHGED